MASLKYRTRQDGADYLWELFTEDGRRLANGYEADSVKARAAGLLAGIREMEKSQRTLIAVAQ